MKTRTGKILLILMGCCGLSWGQSAGAIEVPINITGEIYNPPCKINGDNADIYISFGKIAIQKVDGTNHAVSKTVSVNCEYFQGKPYIHLFSGSSLAGAPDHVLQTTGANPSALGIALYQGEGVDPAFPLRIGGGDKGGYEIKKGMFAQNVKNTSFTFTAVPYKQGNKTLNAGPFSASVTMSIGYP